MPPREKKIFLHLLYVMYQPKSTYFSLRVNYIVSPCGLHKITNLGTDSLKSPSRVLTFHFVTFGGINL
ncbi:hypothetical protein Hanom_Chr00s128469g01814481 [Helianthus anomalus]